MLSLSNNSLSDMILFGLNSYAYTTCPDNTPKKLARIIKKQSRVVRLWAKEGILFFTLFFTSSIIKNIRLIDKCKHVYKTNNSDTEKNVPKRALLSRF